MSFWLCHVAGSPVDSPSQITSIAPYPGLVLTESVLANIQTVAPPAEGRSERALVYQLLWCAALTADGSVLAPHDTAHIVGGPLPVRILRLIRAA